MDKLIEALQEIIEVASGERQVAEDDTEGMAWIDKRARAAVRAHDEGTDEELTDTRWSALCRDISDRRGLKNEWRLIDDDVKQDIRAAWSRILYASPASHAAEKRAADAEAQVKALSRPVSEIWFQRWKPIINAIGEISVQEAMDAIERGL